MDIAERHTGLVVVAPAVALAALALLSGVALLSRAPLNRGRLAAFIRPVGQGSPVRVRRGPATVTG